MRFYAHNAFVAEIVLPNASVEKFFLKCAKWICCVRNVSSWKENYILQW
ncbi:hypothetical protein B488_01930 [Liberibacter crescens BT-1]|uniref:Uncharacterized protein n=1 Tax=Liberibacter crescens (strain BT-1) TaxID=1215343 RepID=L0EUX3_LIBCB|nr:hypothetical protein B488_01930 [Liberibacter crescens BT-1]